jgi:hypothetical protein
MFWYRKMTGRACGEWNCASRTSGKLLANLGGLTEARHGPTIKTLAPFKCSGRMKGAGAVAWRYAPATACRTIAFRSPAVEA